MFAFLEIAPIYKALQFFADLQGLICFKDLKGDKFYSLLDIIV